MSQLRKYLGQSLGGRVFAAIGVIVLLFAVILTAWDIASERENVLAGLQAQSISTAGLMWLAVETPLRSGQDRETSEQFRLLGEKFPGSSMSLAGADEIITYSTVKGEIKKSASSILHPQIAEAYRSSLENRAPEPFIHSQSGRRKLLVFSPVDNEPSCYHCHGWSRPVLGVAAVAVDVEDQLTALTYRNVGSALVALLSCLLLTCIAFLAVRAKALSRIYALRERSEVMAAEFTAFNRSALGTNLAKNLLERSGDEVGSAQSGQSQNSGHEEITIELPDDELARAARNVEETIIASNGLLLPSLALEAAAAPLLICSLDGRIIHYNRQFGALFGFSGQTGKPENFYGTTLQDALGREAAEKLLPWQTSEDGDNKRMTLWDDPARPRRGGLAELELTAGTGRLTARVYAAPFWNSGSSTLENIPTTRRFSDLPGTDTPSSASGLVLIFCDLTALTNTARELRRQVGLLERKAEKRLEERARELSDAYRRTSDLSQSSSLLTGQLGHAGGQSSTLLDTLGNGREKLEALNLRLSELFAKSAAASGEASRLQAGMRSAAAETESSVDLVAEIETSALRVKEYFEGIERQRADLAQAMQNIQDMADRFNFIALNSAIEASSPTLSARHLRRLADQLRAMSEEALKNTAEARQQLSAFANAAREGLPLAGSALSIASSGVEQARNAAQSLKSQAEAAAILAEQATALIELAGFAQRAGDAAAGSVEAGIAIGEQVQKVLGIAEAASAGMLDRIHQLREVLDTNSAESNKPEREL